MGTEIKTWQIANGKLISVDSQLKNEGRTDWTFDKRPLQKLDWAEL